MEHNINEVKNIEQFENYGRAQAFIEAMQLDTLYECFKYLEPNVGIPRKTGSSRSSRYR